jgi:exodeoxyribonuclease VII large subunit
MVSGGAGDAVPGGSPEHAIPVSALTAAAKDALEHAFPPLWVSGEVSNFTRHRNGHWYFTLKDATASIDCVVWSRDQVRFPAAPDEGMQVVAQGTLSMWAARAKVQFAIKAMEAEGEGLWRKALELTRAALERDGLLALDRKRPIPRFPRCVGVITSADGAAMHDIIAVISRRNPTIDIVIIPAAVQGDTAPDSLVRALGRAAAWGGADVLIIGRGGGSREDLWAFNDERVARAIAASAVPTVSAVGHEVDVTIADLVADHRAATPSAAAELVAPVLDDIRADLRALGTAMSGALVRRARDGRRDLSRVARDVRARALRVVERRADRLRALSGRINALSPLATLARGYALPRTPAGVALSRAAQLTPGARFQLLMQDGEIDATADAVRVRMARESA